LFARKIQLKEVLEKSSPSALLIDIYPITDGVLDETLKIKYEHIRKEIVNGRKKKVKKIVDIPDRFKDKLLLELEKVYEIDTDWNIVGPGSSKIKKNKRTLSISTDLLRKIKIEENNKVENFIGYINRKGLFSVTFLNPKYMYFMDNCFEDRSGISEIDSILEMLEPQKDIEKVTSEKGLLRLLKQLLMLIQCLVLLKIFVLMKTIFFVMI
jgi:hypothetical protein